MKYYNYMNNDNDYSLHSCYDTKAMSLSVYPRVYHKDIVK